MLRLAVRTSPDPTGSTVREDYWQAQRLRAAPILQRAVQRGELPEVASNGLLLALAIAPIYLRLLMTGQPVDEAFIYKVVDAVLGATACGSAASRTP